jgi:hypothetical protein
MSSPVFPILPVLALGVAHLRAVHIVDHSVLPQCLSSPPVLLLPLVPVSESHPLHLRLHSQAPVLLTSKYGASRLVGLMFGQTTIMHHQHASSLSYCDNTHSTLHIHLIILLLSLRLPSRPYHSSPLRIPPLNFRSYVPAYCIGETRALLLEVPVEEANLRGGLLGFWEEVCEAFEGEY